MVMGNALPIMPERFKIQQRPASVESKSQYATVVETLKVIDATKCIEVDVSGEKRNQIITLQQGIRNCAKKMNFPYKIKYCTKDLGNGLATLYIWSNK